MSTYPEIALALVRSAELTTKPEGGREKVLKIKQGDTVEVISGDDLGMRGTVRVADPRKKKIIVEGVNIIIKHQRPVPAGRQQTQGGRIELEGPIDVSQVMLICPSCQQPTRVGYARPNEANTERGAAGAGSGKVRVCRKCNAEI